MTAMREIEFIIDHIDPLGQGVYKENDQIYFIAKTLANERGTALILKSKKNLHFCVVKELKESSKSRVTPSCEHFRQCSGCHFLHTHYEHEIEIKSKSFQRMLSKLKIENFDIIKAPKRLHYRNRIQLHRHGKKIGFHTPVTNEVTEVKKCKIFVNELQSEFDKIYRTRPNFKRHVEIYLKDQVKVNYDQAYAFDGFTQVNKEVNQLMLEKIQNLTAKLEIKSVLDLFAGNGNISKMINYQHRTCLDIYKESKGEFINCDLFKDKAIHILRETQFDLLILDPPRSGFKNLNQWQEKFEPRYILYISCHPMTMIRDLNDLKRNYKVLNTSLIDLFPSTYHFESLILLEIE